MREGNSEQYAASPGGSLSRWLALRRASDFAARSVTLTSLIVDQLAGVSPVRILDLGTGTGSNIAYLAPRLVARQEWLALDRDPYLLAEAINAAGRDVGRVSIQTKTLDLGAVNAPEIFEGRHLVTASALIDLVSSHWLHAVAAQCRRVGACALFTTIYDGRNECTPADRHDALVFELFNSHQLTDKGLGGPAAGPQATGMARSAFESEGFEVRLEPSDWRIGAADPEFQQHLIDGWASAAREMTSQDQHDVIDAWQQRRLEHVAANRSEIVVGHYDLAAIPLRD